MAALCLHGQPFGFTQEDVALLGDLAMIAGTPMYGEMARSLASRIQALLPPTPDSETP